MPTPKVVLNAFASLDPASQRSYRRDLARRRKSLVFAYVAWLMLGWHYLYLGRAGMQFAFWVTFGGFLVWWLLDAIRLPGLVWRYNEDVARELMAQYRQMAGA